MPDRPILDYATGERIAERWGHAARRAVRAAFAGLLVALCVAFLTLGERGKPCALIVPLPSLISFLYCALAIHAGRRSVLQELDPADGKWAIRRAWLIIIGLLASNVAAWSWAL